MNVGRFSYAVKVECPEGYRCCKCGLHGVKLWREYQTFADHAELLCGKCAMEREGKTGRGPDLDGRIYSPTTENMTDQIGWMVPAVPTPDGDTFWGYTSVPLEGVLWWKALPTDPTVLALVCKFAKQIGVDPERVVDVLTTEKRG